MRGLVAASCVLLAATSTLSAVDAMQFNRVDWRLATNASALPTASTFTFDGNTSDLARQLYARFQMGASVTKVVAAKVPAKVQTRLDNAGAMEFDDLPGLVQCALLWDSGYVLDPAGKIVKIRTLSGRSMADIFVSKEEFNAAGCEAQFCPSTGVPGSLSYKSRFCNGDQMLSVAKCVSEDLVGGSDFEAAKSSMWSTGSDPNSSPDITIRYHAWTDAGVDYTVYAIHTAKDVVGYANCPSANKYGAVVIPCHRMSAISSVQQLQMKEPLTSDWLDTWLLEFPSTTAAVPPAGAPVTSSAPATIAAPSTATSTGEPKPVSLGVILGIGAGAFLLLLLIVLCLLRRRRAKDDSSIQAGRRNNFNNEGYHLETEGALPAGSRVVFNQQRAGIAGRDRVVSSQQAEAPAGSRVLTSHQLGEPVDSRVGVSQRTDALAGFPVVMSQPPERTHHEASAGKMDSKQQYALMNAGANGLWEDRLIVRARIERERLHLETLISRGECGEVYRGRYNSSAVAIKQLSTEARSDPRKVDALLAEAKALASLNHPQVVRLIGVAWNSRPDLCVVTEIMEGGNLHALLTMFEDVQHREHGFDNDKLKVALHIAHALAYLHSQEPIVLHCSLASKNVLLDAKFNAKLTGIGAPKERSYHAMTAASVDSSMWIAPEVMMGGYFDQRADVYSFGIILSELDSHTPPHSAFRQSHSDRHLPDTAVLQMIATGRLSVEFSPNATHAIVALGKQCVARNPNDRPLASEVLFRLQRIVTDIHEQQWQYAVNK